MPWLRSALSGRAGQHRRRFSPRPATGTPQVALHLCSNRRSWIETSTRSAGFVRDRKGWNHTQELDVTAPSRSAAPGQALVCAHRRHRRCRDGERRASRRPIRRSRDGRSHGREAAKAVVNVPSAIAQAVPFRSSRSSGPKYADACSVNNSAYTPRRAMSCS